MRYDDRRYERIRVRLMAAMAIAIIAVALLFSSMPALAVLLLAFFPVLFIAVIIDPLTRLVYRLTNNRSDTE